MQDRNGILAIGNLLVDRTLLISDYPKESMLALISHMELHCGGGCTNVLFNLSKLDPSLPLFLAGAIGHDSEGRFILNQAQQRNINVDNVVTMTSPTSFTDVMINSQSGERTFFHHLGAMAEYQLEHLLAINHSAKIVHIAYIPLLPQFLDQVRLKDVLTQLHQRGFLISIDLVSVAEQSIFNEYILPILPFVDYVVINDIEAKFLSGYQGENMSDDVLQNMALNILEHGVRQNVIVHSPKCAVAVDRTKQTCIAPSYWVDKKDIVSTLGAGDAFCSGVLYGLHQNLPLCKILQLGHASAYFNLFSISSTDGAVSYGELCHFIEEQKTNFREE